MFVHSFGISVLNFVIFVLKFGICALKFGMSVHNFGICALNPGGNVLVFLPVYLPLRTVSKNRSCESFLSRCSIESLAFLPSWPTIPVCMLGRFINLSVDNTDGHELSKCTRTGEIILAKTS